MLARQYCSLTPKGHQRPCFASPSDVHPDLTEDVFREAVEYARDCTAIMDNGHLAPTARGTFMYHNSIAKICELMAIKGWKSESVKNLPYTISEDGSVKITVATGDASTGIKGGIWPKTKRKGQDAVSLRRPNDPIRHRLLRHRSTRREVVVPGNLCGPQSSGDPHGTLKATF